MFLARITPRLGALVRDAALTLAVTLLLSAVAVGGVNFSPDHTGAWRADLTVGPGDLGSFYGGVSWWNQ